MAMKLDKILVWVVIIVAVVYVANYVGIFSTAGGGLSTTTPTGAACLFADTTTIAGTAVRSLLSTIGAETGITAETVSVYTTGDTTAPFAQYMTVAGVANTSVAVPCHTQYKLALENSALYYNMSYPTSGYLGAEHAAEASKLKLEFVGAIAMTQDNSTTLGSTTATAAGGAQIVMGNSGTSVPMTMHIRQTAAQGVFKGPIVMGFSYNNTAFVSARAIGWTSIACPSWTPATTFAGTTETNPYRMCYTYPNSILDVSQLDVPIEFVSSATGPVITNVSIRVGDTGGAFKSGLLETGFINPNNGNDWGVTDGTFLIHVE